MFKPFNSSLYAWVRMCGVWREYRKRPLKFVVHCLNVDGHFPIKVYGCCYFLAYLAAQILTLPLRTLVCIINFKTSYSIKILFKNREKKVNYLVQKVVEICSSKSTSKVLLARKWVYHNARSDTGQYNNNSRQQQQFYKISSLLFVLLSCQKAFNRLLLPNKLSDFIYTFGLLAAQTKDCDYKYLMLLEKR